MRNPYVLSMLAFVVFIGVAFWVDSPAEVFAGFKEILLSRSLLNTDYIDVGGIGATFLNVALTGAFCTLMFMVLKVRPSGAALMAIWITVSFSFFGKNFLNGMPIHLGTWLYAFIRREPFANYAVKAATAATLSPVVSELAFMHWQGQPIDGMIGVLAGIGVGFLMPAVTSFTAKIHGGYLLYNNGFAGGIIAVLMVALIGNMGIELVRPTFWSSGNNKLLALIFYVFFACWILCGWIGTRPRAMLTDLVAINRHAGRAETDYYARYGNEAYINMGLCGMLGLTVTLVLKAELNGATLAGVMSMMAFGAHGKNLRNCIPVMAGAIVAATFNPPPPTEPGNIMAILFCTGLSPISGKFGWGWGVAAGYLHLAIFNHVSGLTGGLNLYNNGFAAGFVVIILLPVIRLVYRKKKIEED